MKQHISYVSPAEAIQMQMADDICAALFGSKKPAGPDWDSWHSIAEQINQHKAFFATVEGGGAGSVFIQIEIVETGMYLAFGDVSDKWAAQVFVSQSELQDGNSIDAFELEIASHNRNPFEIAKALITAWDEFNRTDQSPAERAVESVEFDYKNQAWLVNGRYVACGHGQPCTCYGTIHEGELAATDAEVR